jgi:hypothetical protein
MRRTDGFVTRQIDDMYLLVPIGQRVMDFNGLVELNESGAFIWGQMEGGQPAEALAQALADEFDVSLSQAQADVDAFLAKMARLGLVEEI